MELSAELLNVSALIKAYNMPNIGSDNLNIKLIEAAPRLPGALHERRSDAARQEKQQLGVQGMERSPIKEANHGGYLTHRR